MATTREIETKGTRGKKSRRPPKTFLTRPLKFGSRRKKRPRKSDKDKRVIYFPPALLSSLQPFPQSPSFGKTLTDVPPYIIVLIIPQSGSILLTDKKKSFPPESINLIKQTSITTSRRFHHPPRDMMACKFIGTLTMDIIYRNERFSRFSIGHFSIGKSL